MAGKVQRKWKKLSCDVSDFSATDFEFFGGIEELTDYEVIGPESESRKRQADSSGRIKKKKKRKVVAEDDDDSPKKDIQNQHCDKEEEEDIDMSAWCNLHVPDDILTALKDMRFEKPTKIQELALPAGIRDHQDILAAAETGSGKTLAFGIPMIAHILEGKERMSKSPDDVDPPNLLGLVLTPTRELAIQVKNHLQDVSKYVDIKVVVVIGGMSLEKQRRLLKKCPDIIVATPGRLWQLMDEKEPYLEKIPSARYLVIDEADRMVEHGHFEELTKILEIMNANREEKRRQTFVFSATLTMTHELPKRLILKKSKVVPKNKLDSLMKLIGMKDKPKIIDITQKKGVVETLSESQITCSLEEKDTYLYYFKVMYPGRTLVFCNSISCVRRLKSVLEHLGCTPLALHASMHQRQRLKNLDTFASSQGGLLLATDVAARGLDIKGIEHVVHFQVPRTAEIYIHRSGRTARAQNEGLSLMLIEPQEAVFYKRICKTLNKDGNLPIFPIDHGVLKVVKNRVLLARQIDQLEHRGQRLEAQNNWFIKAAKEMDIDVEDEGLLNELGNDCERSVKSQKLKAMKKQLKQMLNKAIIPKMFMGSYPTKTGKLLQPEQIGNKKAVEVLKSGSDKHSAITKKRKRKFKSR